MSFSFYLFVVVALIASCKALRYEEQQHKYNLNQNEKATDPLDYWGEWTDHEFFPSPSNWRMPMYSLFLDRFVNGLVNNVERATITYANTAKRPFQRQRQRHTIRT